MNSVQLGLSIPNFPVQWPYTFLETGRIEGVGDQVGLLILTEWIQSQKSNFQEPFFSKGICGNRRKGYIREQLGSSSVSHPTKEHCGFSFLVSKFYPILLGSHGLQSYRLYFPWNLPGKNIGVGCHALLRGIFPTQGLFPVLQHCMQILYWLSHQRCLY